MRRLKILFLFGLVLLFAAATSEAALQPTRARLQRLDHFWCYVLDDNVAPDVAGVYLQDQFDIPAGAFQKARVGVRQWFCNPVVKRHANRVTQVRDKDAHLEFYELPPTTDVEAPERLVIYSNQFQRQHAAVLGDPVMLAVPTQKLEPGNHGFPQRLDHFKCYAVEKSKPAGAAVGLADQFSRTASSVDVGDLKLFCNPTRKIRVDANGNVTEVTGVQNATDHLACYTAPGGLEEPVDVRARNQFGDEGFRVQRAGLLCVPTVKHQLGDTGNLTDLAPGRPGEG